MDINDSPLTVSGAAGSDTNGAGRYTLPKNERLSSRNDIGRLFTHGEAFLVYPIKCTFRWRTVDEAGPGNRIMVIVPKRNHRRAVARNLLKRRMREAYRLHKHLLSCSSDLSPASATLSAAGVSFAGADIAFSYIAKGEPADYRTIERSVVTILNKLCTIRNEKTGTAENGL